MEDIYRFKNNDFYTHYENEKRFWLWHAVECPDEFRDENGKPHAHLNGAFRFGFQPRTGFKRAVADPRQRETLKDLSGELFGEPPLYGENSGVGMILLANDDLYGVDIDDCIDKHRNIDPEAIALAQSFDPPIYWELSPSGSGLRGWGCWGDVPQFRPQNGSIEFYTCRKALSITGDVLQQPGIDSIVGAPVYSDPTPYLRRGGLLVNRFQRLRMRVLKGPSGQNDELVYKCLEVIDPDIGFYNWKCIGLAIYNEGLPFDVWDEWSANGSKYKPGECQEIWDKFVPSIGGPSVGTLIYHAKHYDPKFSAENPAKPIDLFRENHRTDNGLAHALSVMHKGEAYWCSDDDNWYRWNSKHWEVSHKKLMYATTKKFADELYQLGRDELAEGYRTLSEIMSMSDKDRSEIIDEVSDDELADIKRALDAIKKFTLSPMGKRKQSEIIDLACPSMRASITQFDNHPELLNCSNGTINLRTGELLPHNKEHFLTRMVNYEYHDTPSPEMQTQIDLIKAQILMLCQGDQDTYEYIRRFMGWCGVGHVDPQAFLINIGGGNNGKTVLWSALASTLGPYAMEANAGLMVKKRFEDHPTELAQLRDKRFVLVGEFPEGKHLNVERCKQFTRMKIRARLCGKDYFEFDNGMTVVLDTNEKPEIRETDTGTWRRPKVLDSGDKEIENVDDKFHDKLTGEGMLYFVVEAARDYLKKGLPQPSAKMRKDLSLYRSQQDQVQAFINECCDVGEDLQEVTSDLFNAFQDFLEEPDGSWDAKIFGRKLTAKGFGKARNKKDRLRTGIELNAENKPDY